MNSRGSARLIEPCVREIPSLRLNTARNRVEPRVGVEVGDHVAHDGLSVGVVRHVTDLHVSGVDGTEVQVRAVVVRGAVHPVSADQRPNRQHDAGVEDGEADLEDESARSASVQHQVLPHQQPQLLKEPGHWEWIVLVRARCCSLRCTCSRRYVTQVCW